MIPIPVSLKEFWDVFLDLAKKWRQRHAEGKFRHAKLGRQSPLLADVLSELYPTFERPWADRRYPVILFRVPESQITKPESILGSLADEVVVPDRSLRQAGDEYLDDLRTVGHSLITNNGTYVLKAMNANEIVNLDCAHGTYFDALATCDLLEWELLSTLGKTKARSVASVVNQLKWRSYVHYLSHEPTTCPIGRSAAIAVSTTILFRRTNDYAVLVQRRSDKGVAVHGDFLHVAPSFMFQPVVGEWTKEYSVVHNIYREYLEELFSVKEASVAPSVMAVDYFYGNPNLKFLRSLIDAGDAVLPDGGQHVVETTHDRQPVDRGLPGVAHVDESADVEAHPAAPAEGPGQGARLLVAAGDQGGLGGDAVGVEGVRDAPDQEPPDRGGGQAEDEQRDDEAPRDVDARREGDQCHHQDAGDHRLEEALQLGGDVRGAAQVVQSVDGEDDRPDEGGREDGRVHLAQQRRTDVEVAVAEHLGQEVAEADGGDVDNQCEHRREHRPAAEVPGPRLEGPHRSGEDTGREEGAALTDQRHLGGVDLGGAVTRRAHSGARHLLHAVPPP